MTLTFEFQGQIAAIFKYYMIDKVFINAFHLKYPNTGFSSLRTHKQAVLYRFDLHFETATRKRRLYNRKCIKKEPSRVISNIIVNFALWKFTSIVIVSMSNYGPNS
jgi:hypothetical protein